MPRAHAKRPSLVTNAWIGDELTLRVGVPHFNGTLPAHCAENDYPVMVSAGAFWRPRPRAFVEPSRWPWSTDACDLALDSAGFVAMKHWAAQGVQPGMADIFPWTLLQYLCLAIDAHPRWYSQPDACVEPEIALDDAEVERRCQLTNELLQLCLSTAAVIDRDHQNLGLRPPVPVLQGWTVDQYRRSLDRALASWELFTAGTRFERLPTLIGVGSVCRRSLHDRQHGLWRVLDAIAADLPTGVRLHLFGVKGEALQSLHHYPMVASVDSMAWDFRARADAWSTRRPNTMAHRVGHMDRWLERHLSRMDTNTGARQHLLTLGNVSSQRPLPQDLRECANSIGASARRPRR